MGSRVFQEQILAVTISLPFEAFRPVNRPLHPPHSRLPTAHSPGLAPCARCPAPVALRLSPMKKISASLDTSPSPESGVTDSPWQPSWWQWLISALSGTLEIERQIAWLKQSNEAARRQHELRMSDLRKSTEELRKSNEEGRRQHEQRMSELRKENERLAELELKLDAVLPKSVSN